MQRLDAPIEYHVQVAGFVQEWLEGNMKKKDSG